MESKPLDWVIFKVAQRCNINCTYCYVYNRGDDSWKHRPAIVNIDIVSRLADRVLEQCKKFNLKKFFIEFHGGEPLLIGKIKFEKIIKVFLEKCQGIELKFLLQTNGLLIDLEWLSLFSKYKLKFGISLDGPPELADKNRIDHKGNGTTIKLISILDKYKEVQEFKDTFGGILCVIGNPKWSADKILKWFAQMGFHSIGFLLPDGNYDNPPSQEFTVKDYKKFLLSLYQSWIELGEAAPNIRYFEYIIRGLLGEEIPLDSLGGDISRLCVVESDGSIGISDVGRICPPLNVDSMNIFDHSLSEYSKIYKLKNLQELCDKCKKCKFKAGCNGGYLPHRYDGKSFLNPSYFCEAIYSVNERIFEDLNFELSKIK